MNYYAYFTLLPALLRTVTDLGSVNHLLAVSDVDTLSGSLHLAALQVVNFIIASRPSIINLFDGGCVVYYFHVYSI